MSTDRYSNYGGFLNLRYRAVAAVEYVGATLKAAFQLAAAPADDPVKSLYAAFHALRKTSEDLHTKYRDQFADWAHEGKDENGDTGVWRARVDCMDIIRDRLEQEGVVRKGSRIANNIVAEEGGNLSYLRMLIVLQQFEEAATSEFRFRHALDYNTSARNGMPKSGLEKIAPVIRAALPELAAISVEDLRASKEKHAAQRAAVKQQYNLPGP